MAKYILHRRGLWFAVMEIPLALRPRFGGKVRFLKSLGTDSKATAMRRSGPIVAMWKRDIAAAKGNPNDNDAEWLRRAIRNAKSEDERKGIVEQIEDTAYWVGAVNVEQLGMSPYDNPEAKAFFSRATSHEFLDDLDGWLAMSNATARTQAMQQSVVEDFAKSFPLVEDIDRPSVKRWVMAKLVDGLSPRTVNRFVSVLRSYYRHLVTLGIAVDSEPFSRLEVARGHSKESERTVRQAFTPGEVVRLLEVARAKGDEALASIIDLARWTGARREELASLRCSEISLSEGYFTVIDAKTKAGNRDVPIHSKLAATMARLTEVSRDGYVISGLTSTKFGHRSDVVGKRFGKLKTKLGFGEQLVLHSIRKTVASQLENAGVAEGVVADILGHDKPSMTYGLYSGGASLETKRTAVEKLNYPLASREQ